MKIEIIYSTYFLLQSQIKYKLIRVYSFPLSPDQIKDIYNNNQNLIAITAINITIKTWEKFDNKNDSKNMF